MSKNYFSKLIIILIGVYSSGNFHLYAQTIPTSFTRTENDIYRQDDDGNWVKIERGEITYSPTQLTIDGQNATGHIDGSDASADRLNITTAVNGDTNIEAYELNVNNNNGGVYQAEQANITGKNGTMGVEAINASGTNGEYTANGNRLTFGGTVDNATISGEGVGLADSDGNALSFGTVDAVVDSDSTLIEGTDVSATDGEGTHLTFGTINAVQNADGTTVDATNGTGAFGTIDVNAATLNGSIDPDQTTLSGTGVDVTDTANGNTLSFGTINAVQNADGTTIDATNATGTFGAIDASADTLTGSLTPEQTALSGTGVDITDSSNGVDLSFGTLTGRESDTGIELDATNATLTYEGYDASASGLNGSVTPEQAEIRATGVSATTVNGNNLSFGSIEGVQNDNGTTIDASNVSGSYDGVIGTSETLRFQENLVNGETTLSGTNAEIIETNGRGNPTVRLNSFSATTFEGRTGTDINVDGTFERTAGSTPISFGLDAEQVEGASYNRTENGGILSIETGDDGGISDASVKLGDSISFHATDSDGNANELTVSYHLDKEAGQFSMEVVYRNGDQVEVKVLPFTFTSEQAIDETAARLQLSASANPQDIQAYLATISGLNNFDYVNDFLSVGNGKMRVRIGGSSGVEMIYSNPGQLTGTSLENPDNEKMAIGLGMFNRGAEGSESSLGVLLSADSSLSYEVGSGSLSVAGMPLPDRGEIPLTLGMYASHTYTNGTTVFGHLGASIKNFEEVSYSAALGVSTEIGENSTFDVAVSGNTEGDYALSAVFGVEFGARSAGISDAQRAANRNMSAEERRRILTRPVRGLGQ